MKYRIVYAGTVNDLVILVNNFIKDGWKPSGGVSVDTEISVEDAGRIKALTRIYFQALIIGEKNESD